MDTITEGMEDNNITATLGVDQSAALDCVEHPLLLQKIHYYGLDGATIGWIESYLQHRSFYVAIGSTSSNIKTTSYGVPQGSVMGPLLYLLYINDFTAIVEDDKCENTAHLDKVVLFGSECRKCGSLPVFADDGQFLVSSRSRGLNQDVIEYMFLKIKDYLNSSGPRGQ